MVAELTAARAAHWEDPAGALAAALAAEATARREGRDSLLVRALALRGAIALNRGDLPTALAVSNEAQPYCAADAPARAEIAAMRSQLAFFSGSYAAALGHAEDAVAIADDDGDTALRLFVRRSACLVFGNVGVAHWSRWLAGTLELAIAVGDRWQQALSHNDIACWHQQEGRLEAAETEIERGLAALEPLARADFALGVLLATRADIRLLGGQPELALADADSSLAHQFAQASPNPYVLGITVRAQVQALAALERLDDARLSSEDALEQLGERVPYARYLVLSTLADALYEAGRAEEAYLTLQRSVAAEREGLRDLSELRVHLERARLEAGAARRSADDLSAKNAELEALVQRLNEAHVELERRAAELEALQEQLSEQADRDWLTGLHNRRYLARELKQVADDAEYSLAVLDLDRFKQVNDTYGHDVGDRVLVGVADVLLRVIRRSDVLARTGGEEFVLLMPGADAQAAARCCERALAAIRDADWGTIAPGLTVTVSAGIARSGEALGLDRVAALADRRLYDAKRLGRDRVV